MAEWQPKGEEVPKPRVLPAAPCPHCKNLQNERAWGRGACDSCGHPLPILAEPPRTVVGE